MSLLIEHTLKTLKNMARILHRLWLEIIGAVFLGMAAFGSLSLWREWQAYQAGGEMWRVTVALVFVVGMAAFGLHSFLRARRMQ